jgi:hypothetical protein
MRLKDNFVQASLHPFLTAFLFAVDDLYRAWGDECVITSGSEPDAMHSITSLHYALPAAAVDVRCWDKTMGRGEVPSPEDQTTAIRKAAQDYLRSVSLPVNWLDIVIEIDHIHIEFQPKRLHS